MTRLTCLQHHVANSCLPLPRPGRHRTPYHKPFSLPSYHWNTCMHHHAFQASKRNVNALSSEGFSITSIFQAAAGHAWSRRVQPKSTVAYTRLSEVPISSYDDDTQRQHSRGAGPSESLVGLKTVVTCIVPSSRSETKTRVKRKSRKPWVNINPTRLSDSDFEFVDPASSYTLPSDIYHIGPSEVLLPEPPTIHDKAQQPSPPVTFKIPTKTSELTSNLFKWTSSRYGPIPPFSTLHAYHSNYHRLQSKKSFRILAEVAINESNFGGVRTLLKEMDIKGMATEWQTPMWEIWIRWMVRRGKWADAWRTVTRSIERAAPGKSNMPLPLWLEFWGSAKMRALRKIKTDRHGKRRLDVAELPYELNSDMGRYYFLMRYAPRLDELQLMDVPPRMVYVVVRARLWGGKREWAMDLTRSYFRSIASGTGDKDKELRMCLMLIHLHLSVGWGKMGFQTLKAMRGITEELLELNPKVKPNSRTLVLLLRNLRGTRTSGINALRLVKEFRTRYGDLVEDREVGLRVAALAAKEGSRKVLGRVMTRTSFGIVRKGG